MIWSHTGWVGKNQRSVCNLLMSCCDLGILRFKSLNSFLSLSFGELQMCEVSQCNFKLVDLLAICRWSKRSTVYIIVRSLLTGLLSALGTVDHSQLELPVAKPGSSEELSSDQQGLLARFSLLTVQVSRYPECNWTRKISCRLTLHYIQP